MKALTQSNETEISDWFIANDVVENLVFGVSCDYIFGCRPRPDEKNLKREAVF